MRNLYCRLFGTKLKKNLCFGFFGQTRLPKHIGLAYRQCCNIKCWTFAGIRRIQQYCRLSKGATNPNWAQIQQPCSRNVVLWSRQVSSQRILKFLPFLNLPFLVIVSSYNFRDMFINEFYNNPSLMYLTQLRIKM